MMTRDAKQGNLLTKQSIRLALGGEYCLRKVFPAGFYQYVVMVEANNISDNEIAMSIKVNNTLIDTIFILPLQRANFESVIPGVSLKKNEESSVEISSILVTNNPSFEKTEVTFSIFQENPANPGGNVLSNFRQNADYLKEIDFLRGENVNLRENLRIKEVLLLDINNAIMAKEA